MEEMTEGVGQCTALCLCVGHLNSIGRDHLGAPESMNRRRVDKLMQSPVSAFALENTGDSCLCLCMMQIK